MVQQQFISADVIKVKPFLYTKNLINLNVKNKNKLNFKKQKRALMPNLVHSLDAASLALVIDSFFKIENEKNFYSIHDCFALNFMILSFM